MPSKNGWFQVERAIVGDGFDGFVLVGDAPEGAEVVVIALLLEGEGYFTPGVTWAAPEDCYPDDGSAEVLSAVDDRGEDWIERLTDDEVERAREALLASIQSSYDEDRAEDRAYDREEQYDY